MLSNAQYQTAIDELRRDALNLRQTGERWQAVENGSRTHTIAQECMALGWPDPASLIRAAQSKNAEADAIQKLKA